MLLAVVLLAGAGLTAGADAPVPAVKDTQPVSASLVVALVVNGVETPELVSVEQDGARFLVMPDALRHAGLAVPGSAAVDVTALPGAHAHYDAEGQRLILDVPLALLPTRHLGGTRARWAEPAVSTGALLNYDLFVQNGGGVTTASLVSEQRAFGAWGTVANTGVWRTGGAFVRGVVRYDTTYRYNDERHALIASAGDVLSGALSWSRSVRLGGVRIARSFDTRPDLITVPLPDFAGQAALPSGVDLFVNGYHQQHEDVLPGRFVLDQVPVVNGAGEARVVTTDAAGRQIETVIPYYVAPELLRRRLTDFSVEAGALRRDYGIRSFGYGRAVVSAAARHGLTNRLTIEAHVEAAAALAMVGGGAVWSPGRIGTIHTSLATSRRDDDGGTRLTVGYSYVGRSFSIGVERVAQSRSFADLGSFDLAAWRGRSGNLRAIASTRIAAIGSLGVGYVDARARDGTRARIASASLSLPLGRRASLFTAADYDIGRHGAIAQLRLVMPLGTNSVASAGFARESDGSMQVQADAVHSLPSDGGFGWAASGAWGSRGDLRGQGNATYRAPSFTAEAGVAHDLGASSAYASISGAVAVLGGRPYLANELPDAFAVVMTGMPGVPVYYENQPVGRTARDGRLFVPRVVAYHPGQFSIDIASMPTSAQAPVMSKREVFREGTGGVVYLTVQDVRSAVVRLVDANGATLRPGTAIAFDGGLSTVVGWDGVVLIEGVTGSVSIKATRADGSTCVGLIAVPADAAPAAALGTVTCR